MTAERRSTSIDRPTIVLLPTQDLAALLAEVRSLKNDFDRFKKTHNDFTVRTTNEIDDLFAKVDKRPTVPDKKQA